MIRVQVNLQHEGLGICRGLRAFALGRSGRFGRVALVACLIFGFSCQSGPPSGGDGTPEILQLEDFSHVIRTEAGGRYLWFGAKLAKVAPIVPAGEVEEAATKPGLILKDFELKVWGEPGAELGAKLHGVFDSELSPAIEGGLKADGFELGLHGPDGRLICRVRAARAVWPGWPATSDGRIHLEKVTVQSMIGRIKTPELTVDVLTAEISGDASAHLQGRGRKSVLDTVAGPCSLAEFLPE